MTVFKNEIVKVSYKEVQAILKNATKDIHVAEINGKYIQSWKDYSLEIEEKMDFPSTCADHNFDGFSDWIRDLSWLNKKGYILIVYNFSEFMKSDPRVKDLIIRMFERSILPWWQEDVEEFCVGGERKPFNVYLVD